jgi:hypothetical protein
MIRRGAALLCSLAVAMCIASRSNAGVWGTQPVLGFSGDYSSNPALLNLPDTAETHAALLLDAPIQYVGDAFKLSVLPSFRLSDSEGYSSLDSDYEHLTVSSEFDTERNTFTASGLVARDSSLYHDYLLSGSTGVRRDTGTADVNWDRQLTERFEVDTDVNSTRVRYGESVGVPTLIDYKYSSVVPTLTWAESELSKFNVSAAAGRYNSLDGTTESTNANLQLGFIKKLSDIWSLTASAGYSRARNQADTFEYAYEITPEGRLILVRFPVVVKSDQNGSIFSVNLSRQTELLLLSAVAMRQLVPTGFAFLSRQENYEARATYTATPRWTFNGDVHRINYQLPGITGNTELHTSNFQLSAVWLWTEHWTLTMTATRVMERYATPNIDISASGVSLELSRQFNWKSLQ